MDIAIDIGFEESDAFRTTVLAASQPVVLEPEARPASVPPPPLSLRTTAPVASVKARGAAVWPVLLCAFVAFTCATVAFLKSPLAHHRSVAPYVAEVNAAYDHAYAQYVR